ncbi:hypothetical protein EFE23_02450 [Micromonospora solifontis]|uniref:PPE family protein n=1 Tax=Micromonospora solifontis TaxID=2487138 RepID=A0ABX9WNX7_9ACTN|nr:hypothetical protein [Micromonospora solifontis]RNM01383.1 hypothetical protein EFE23_02450 [Micromonospora solifontis]
MDVHSMWACLQDQDTSGQWKQVAGWRKICDLALAHLGRLREYRRGLAEAWPPETNAAARAYIGELDQLIDKVQRTHDAAAANYDALAAATRAIGSTRAELKPIHDEYVAKFKQKQAYEEIAADPKAVAGSRLPATSPVTDAELERLNVRARGLMSGLSGELQQAQAMLQRPPVVRPRIDDGEPQPYANAGVPAPIIPPIVAMPIPTTTAARMSQPVAGATRTPTQAAPTSPGPILGGAESSLLTPPTPPPVQPAVSPSTSLTPTNGLPLPPALPQVPDRALRPGGVGKIGGDGMPGHLQPGISKGLTPVAPPKPMPPGGLIGGPPGIGVGPTTGPTTPRRVNPIGGVIGGGGAGTAPSGSAGSRPGGARSSHLTGSHSATPYGGAPYAGNRPGQINPLSQSGDKSRQWDPDHPWETDRGIAPVMRPPDEEGPIDPGPAIGLDR